MGFACACNYVAKIASSRFPREKPPTHATISSRRRWDFRVQNAHAGPADGDAHDDIDANVDDNITGVDLTDVEVVLGGFVVNEEDKDDNEDDDQMTMDVTSKMGVASHPPNEMAIHVDANAEADANALQ